MHYCVTLVDGACDALHSYPREVKEHVADELERLGKHPEAFLIRTPPPCPPFAPIGSHTNLGQLAYGNRRYHFSVFMHVDEEKQEFGVHKIVVQER